MKLKVDTLRQLRRLAPVLDDILTTGEVGYAHHAENLALLATLCSDLYNVYRRLHPDEMDQARCG
ncbi:hypothetical protein [Paraburkholderia sp. JHI869]|uniref:hypothetical protein n=1 Tax=Paraburkholderia sp. JHI869 TaxID=3112959 RepID=UPI003178241A